MNARDEHAPVGFFAAGFFFVAVVFFTDVARFPAGFFAFAVVFFAVVVFFTGFFAAGFFATMM